jgi:hypothetical protein
MLFLFQSVRPKAVHQDLNLDSLLEDLKQNPETSQQNWRETLENHSHSTPGSRNDFQGRWNVRLIDIKQSSESLASEEELREEHAAQFTVTSSSLVDDSPEISSCLSQNVPIEESANPKHRESKSLREEIQEKSTNISSIEPRMESIKPTETNVGGNDWWSLCNQSSTDLLSPQIQTDTSESSLPIQTDHLRVYWIDAYEQSGSVYLFGKVRRLIEFVRCVATGEDFHSSI